MRFLKSRSFYIMALCICVAGILLTIVYGIPETSRLPGISKYSSYLIIAFFAGHILFYTRALLAMKKQAGPPEKD